MNRVGVISIAAAGALTLGVNQAAAQTVFKWLTASPSPQSWNNPKNWDQVWTPWSPGDIADLSQTDITVDMEVQLLPHPIIIGTLRMGDTSGNQKYSISSPGGDKTLTFNVNVGNPLIRFGGTETNGEHRLDQLAAVKLQLDLAIVGNATNPGVGANLAFGTVGPATAQDARIITYNGQIDWAGRSANTGEARPMVSFGASNSCVKMIANNGVFNAGKSAASNLGALPGDFMADFLTLNGGGVRSGGPAGTVLTFEANRGITLGVNGGVLWPGSAAQPMTFNSVISGIGKLYSIGVPGNQGTNTLNAVNTYTGETVVRHSTLVIGSAGSIVHSPTVSVYSNATLRLEQDHALASSAAVRLFSNAGSDHGKVDLAFTGVQAVNELSLDGAFVRGSWGSTSSGAAHKSDTWFVAGSTGILQTPVGFLITVR